MKRTLISALLIFSTQVGFAQFEHPDLKSGKKQVHSVVLMPVKADITRVGMKGPEPMIEESRRVEKDLLPVVGEVMRKLGCDVNNASTSAPDLNPEVAYVVDDLQKQFDAAMQQMVKKSKDVRKGRFSLGDSVSKLPAGENADALIFVRATGQVLTGGKKAFGLLVGGGVYDTVQIDVGVVDAKNGDVLYFAKPFLLKNLAKDPADAKSGIEKSFKNFTKANAAAPKDPQFAKTTFSSAEAAGRAEVTGATSAPQPPAAPANPVTPEPASAAVAAPPPTPASPETATVYVFVQRTDRHIKYSDADVYEKAMQGLANYLNAKNVAIAWDTPRTLSHSEFQITTDKVLAAARYAKAQSALIVTVDRPITKWIEFKVQCLDVDGKELWKASTGSGGGFNGAHGLRVGLDHLTAELDKRLGQPGLPLQVQNSPATAK